jgi:hypothetical protein
VSFTDFWNLRGGIPGLGNPGTIYLHWSRIEQAGILTMTTWAQAIHHPWFDPPHPKRKLSNADDERRASPYQRSSPSPTSRAKRRKFNTLEHGFAHLTLASAPVYPNSTSGLVITPINSTVSSSESSTFPPSSIVLPSSVEEPPHEVEAVAPEVSMENLDEGECKRI